MYTIDATLKARMTALGFEPWHTGGGCMCWSKMLPDRTQLWVSHDSALGELTEIDGGLVALPTGDGWYVGRYNDDGGFVERDRGGTLDEVLSVADELPAPRGDRQEQWSFEPR